MCTHGRYNLISDISPPCPQSALPLGLGNKPLPQPRGSCYCPACFLLEPGACKVRVESTVASCSFLACKVSAFLSPVLGRTKIVNEEVCMHMLLLCWDHMSVLHWRGHSASLHILWRDRLPWLGWWQVSPTQSRENHQAGCPFTPSLGLGIGPLPVKWLLLWMLSPPHKDLLLMHLLEAKHFPLLGTASG